MLEVSKPTEIEVPWGRCPVLANDAWLQVVGREVHGHRVDPLEAAKLILAMKSQHSASAVEPLANAAPPQIPFVCLGRAPRGHGAPGGAAVIVQLRTCGGRVGLDRQTDSTRAEVR
jgi:hypothetical protein